MGHLEDIVVSPEGRGGGIGKKLVVGLKELALARGAYRVNLGCSEDKIRECGGMTDLGLADTQFSILRKVRVSIGKKSHRECQLITVFSFHPRSTQMVRVPSYLYRSLTPSGRIRPTDRRHPIRFAWTDRVRPAAPASTKSSSQTRHTRSSVKRTDHRPRLESRRIARVG